MVDNTGTALTLVNIGSDSGHSVVNTNSQLRRLNYFDGKFLRAPDLILEQQSLLNQVRRSNQAGGAGVVQGFDCALGNDDDLLIGGGSAIDFAGRVLLLNDAISVGIPELIEKSRAAFTAPAGDDGAAQSGDPSAAITDTGFHDCVIHSSDSVLDAAADNDLYLITINHTEAYCGQEDVFGKICAEACSSSTSHSYIIEGIEVRAVPLSLAMFPPESPSVPYAPVHLRSRVASAFFAEERARIPSLISAAGLRSSSWCFGAEAISGLGVPIAVLGRNSTSTLFLDAWIARRERMETPPRHYWAGRMTMRPWNVLLAQVLQFQCQLNKLFQGAGGSPADDPCAETRGAMREASEKVAELMELYEEISTSFAAGDGTVAAPPDELALGLESLAQSLSQGSIQVELPPDQLLISGGIIELPSAGYLPVLPGSSLTVNDQVRRMLGEGVDLRFCSVRPDFVAHALEEAQHMDRISLLQGLDNPARKPEVDVLVPDGQFVETEVAVTGTGYEMSLDLSPVALQIIGNALTGDGGDTGDAIDADATGDAATAPGVLTTLATGATSSSLSFKGAARGEQTAGGGYGFHFAGALQLPQEEGPPAFTLIELLRQSGIWISAELDRDPFAIDRNDSARINGEFTLLIANRVLRSRFNGDLQLLGSQELSDRHRLETRLSVSLTTTATDPTTGVPTSTVSQLSEQIDIARVTGSGGKPTIEVDIDSPGLLGPLAGAFRFRSSRSWRSATQADVTGGLSPRTSAQPAAPSFTLIELLIQAPLFTASQTINPAVLAPSHSAHESAITTLRAIGAALSEPQFEEIAVRRLLPPPKARAADVQLRASHDWVLFHRRRDKRCGDARIPVPELRTRKYRVYLVELRTEAERDTLHEALSANEAATILKLGPVPVGVVEFAAGIQTLESPAELIQAEWRDEAPTSGKLIYGSVASTAEVLDEGENLSRARLANLGTVLSSVTPLADEPRLEVLASIPDAAIISAAPHDGVMVLGAVPQATLCHETVAVRNTREAVANILTRLASIGAADVPSVLEQLNARPLGKAVFAELGTEILEANSADLAANWAALGGGQIDQLVMVSQQFADPGSPTDAETERLELFRNQSAAIGQRLGGAIPAGGVTPLFPEDAAPLSPCPAYTIVIQIEG